MRIQIKHGSFVKVPVAEIETLIGVVRGDSFAGIHIPMTPNPRKFTSNSKIYKRCLNTIINEPELFLFKNSGGITVFVSDFTLEADGSVTLELDETRDGIGNGGHTYQIMRNFGTAKSHVKMQIVKGLPQEDLVDVVESLNLAKRIETYSLEDKRGTFDWHREALGELAGNVRYHEGDKGLIDIREAIGALHVFLFTRSGEKNASSAYRGSVNINHHALIKLKKDAYVKQVSGITRDVHELHHHIITNQNYMALCELSHAKGWKRRLQSNEFGLIRSIANLVLLGVAVAGSELSDDRVIHWKQGFNTHSLRCDFADDMFRKVFDIVIVEDGTLSSCCKRESVIEKVVRQAEIVLEMRNASVQMVLV